MNRIQISLFLILACCSLLESRAQKTDTIVHINGNILTGDLKKMASGVFTWKMDGMGTISLEEPKVNTIISKKQFQIKLESGILVFGSFDASDEEQKVYIVTETERMLLPIDEIVEIHPIKRTFFMRTSGSFSLGLNYTKGSETTTLAFSGNMDYRNERTYLLLEWDTNNTFQRDTLNSQKSDILFSWQRSLRKGWSTNVSVGASQNLELGTQLRTYLNLTGIKDLVYNDWNRLYLGMGTNFAREIPLDDSNITNDVAGLFIIYWKVYKLSNPKIWVDANLSYLPYFTDNRNRLTFNLNPKVSILSNNFKIGLNFYYTYDSQPVAAGAANDDYGLNLQFTYTYN